MAASIVLLILSVCVVVVSSWNLRNVPKMALPSRLNLCSPSTAHITDCGSRGRIQWYTRINMDSSDTMRDGSPPRSALQRAVDSVARPISSLVARPVQQLVGSSSSVKGSGRSVYGSGGRKYPRNPVARMLSTLAEKLRAIVRSPRKLAQFSLLVVAMLVFARYSARSKAAITELPYSKFLELLSQSPQKVKSLRVSPLSFRYILDGAGPAFTKIVSIESSLLERLIKSGVEFSAISSPKSVVGALVALGYVWFLWRVTSRMLQGPQDGDAAGRGRDKLRLQAYGNLSFDDVAGQDAAKREVQEVCEMLQDTDKYTRVGARLPSGVLLVGPPGSGKTLLARVAAAEARVPFFACSASDFVEVFVGRGPARVRRLFKQAAESAPSIVFIDEIDSIGRSRRASNMNSEQETTLNQILTCMDGLDTSNNGVIVMAATNRLELLDPALLRAGRFDRLVQCPLPDKHGRHAILKVHTRSVSLGPSVDLERVAALTAGCSGADLSALCNEAAIRTVRRQGELLEAGDFEDALRTFYSARGISLQNLGEVAAGYLGLQK